MATTIKSRKAKARRLQNWTAEQISKIFKVPWGKDELIAPREMGQSGTDVRLIGEMLDKFPWSVECFAEDTLVLTRDGYVPIQNIRVGDKVFTHRERFRKVLSTNKRYSSNLISLKPKHLSDSIIVTPEHPFEGFYGEWVKADNVKYLSHICYSGNTYDTTKTRYKIWNRSDKSSYRYIKNKNIPEEIYLNYRIAYLFGLYIAEGYASNGIVCWTFHENENKLINAVVDICRKEFRIDPSVVSINNSKAVQVRANSVLLMNAFKVWLDSGSYNKRLGELIFHNKFILSRVLRGYFDGDGCIANDFARCETVSRKLAYDIHFSLLRFGIFSSITVANKENSKISTFLYSVQVSRSCLNRFKNMLSGNFKYTRDLDNIEISSDYDIVFSLNRHRILSSVCNNKIKKDDGIYVYNLSVDEDESYIIEGGTVVHNCKNEEKWSVPAYVRQAKENKKENTNWLVVCKKNHHEEIVIMDAEVFFMYINMINILQENTKKLQEDNEALRDDINNLMESEK